MNNTNVSVKTNQIDTKKVVIIGLASALAFILTYLKFPVAFIGFLELELSDVPALICGLVYGPVAGILVELIKNAVHLTSTTTGGVGEIANFLVTSSYVLGASLVYKHMKSSKRLIYGFIVGTIALTVSGILINYFVTIPMYIEVFFGGNEQVLYGIASKMIPAITDLKTIMIYGFFPFNLLKGITISIVGHYVFRLVKNRI